MTTENPSATGGVSFAESVIAAGDGVRLHLRVAQVQGPIRADVLLTHGLGEHAGRYAHVATALAARGLRVIGYDLRGHGRSSGRRGDVERYEYFLEDLRAVHTHAPWSGGPVFLFGHSLGGQVTLRFLQRDRPEVAGAVVASPWLELAFAPPWWKLFAARAALHFAPGLRFGTGMRVDRLSRDAEHVRSMADSHLMSHRISARMFFAVCEAGEEALRCAEEVRAPLLLLHGDADPVTHWRATETFCRRASSPEKTLRIYPGVLHEAHNDIGRDQVIADIAAWIEARLG